LNNDEDFCFASILVVVAFAFVLPLALLAAQAFAGTPESGAGQVANQGIKIAYLFAVAIAAFGGTQGQSNAISTALEGIARNPAAADKVQTPLILGLAFIESLVIFTLISIFLI